MATKTETDAELRAQVEALRGDLEKLTELFLRSGQEHAGRLVEGARKTGTDVLDEALGSMETGIAYGERQIAGAEDWIRRNPLVAVLGALGVGYVVAQLRDRR